MFGQVLVLYASMAPIEPVAVRTRNVLPRINGVATLPAVLGAVAQLTATPPSLGSGLGDALTVHEKSFRAAASAMGMVGVGPTVGGLRARGLESLARRLSANATARGALAHPDLPLEEDISSALGEVPSGQDGTAFEPGRLPQLRRRSARAVKAQRRWQIRVRCLSRRVKAARRRTSRRVCALIFGARRSASRGGRQAQALGGAHLAFRGAARAARAVQSDGGDRAHRGPGRTLGQTPRLRRLRHEHSD